MESEALELEVEIEKLHLDHNDFIVLRLGESFDLKKAQSVVKSLSDAIRPYLELNVHAIVLAGDMTLDKVSDDQLKSMGLQRIKEENSE